MFERRNLERLSLSFSLPSSLSHSPCLSVCLPPCPISLCAYSRIARLSQHYHLMAHQSRRWMRACLIRFPVLPRSIAPCFTERWMHYSIIPASNYMTIFSARVARNGRSSSTTSKAQEAKEPTWPAMQIRPLDVLCKLLSRDMTTSSVKKRKDKNWEYKEKNAQYRWIAWPSPRWHKIFLPDDILPYLWWLKFSATA